MRKRLSLLRCGLMVGAAALAAVVVSPPLAAQSAKRTVYVSVLDKDDNPITDMQAADFELKDAGKVQEISVKPATESLRVSILVADWGTGSFQAGTLKFLEPLVGHGEFQIVSLLPQPIVAMSWASDGRSLSDGLSKIGQRGRQPGGQLIEAIQESTKTVRGQSKRPVILVLRIGQENPSTISGNIVREDIRKSGAILHVINLGVRTAAAESQPGSTLAQQQAQQLDMEARDSQFALAQVLGDGARESGGRNVQVISTTLTNIMANFAQDLLHQYEISYTSNASKPGEKISVASKRKNVTIKAPNQARF